MGNNTSLFRIVILTATSIEYQAVRSYLTSVRNSSDAESTHLRGVLDTGTSAWEIALVGAGDTAAGTVEYIINDFKPDIVLLVGVAEGLKNVRMGDVVATAKVDDGHSNDVCGTLSDKDRLHSTFDLEKCAHSIAKTGDWLRGIIGSIPAHPPRAFIVPITRVKSIPALTNLLDFPHSDAPLIGIEDHIFLDIIHAYSHIPTLLICGVSNIIQDEKSTDVHDWQKIAARHASAFTFVFLEKLECDESLVRADRSLNEQRKDIQSTHSFSNLSSTESDSSSQTYNSCDQGLERQLRSALLPEKPLPKWEELIRMQHTEQIYPSYTRQQKVEQVPPPPPGPRILTIEAECYERFFEISPEEVENAELAVEDMVSCVLVDLFGIGAVDDVTIRFSPSSRSGMQHCSIRILAQGDYGSFALLPRTYEHIEISVGKQLQTMLRELFGHVDVKVRLSRPISGSITMNFPVQEI